MGVATQPIPPHLKKYVVEQNYSRYTEEDQAVWRFIMRQLKDFLSLHAHSCYVEGLKRTGIDIERIPDISVMDQKLSEFGWRAVPVSGFIPPAAFMEFQSLGILPIASDMRSIEHLTYTPAPDIVHEAAGHAPILINPEFAQYLKNYAEVARNAIITREDMDQYEAIRELSDVKENPDSTPNDIRKAEENLNQVNGRITEISEAGWLSRMNWWTAEYGLIGSLTKPRIFGAGLLSSVGESRHCLSAAVRKLPLSVECIDVAYDITEPQPQLFVANDFQQLNTVLSQMAERMAFRIGGVSGLERARKAKTVNTVELDSGLQISGVLESYHHLAQAVDFVKFSGPVALAVGRRELPGHGNNRHPQGFSSPLGPLRGPRPDLSTASDHDLEMIGVRHNATVKLTFQSGIELTGRVQNWIRNGERLILIQFSDCRIQRGTAVLFQPDWGSFDLAIGQRVVSVFGGPADRSSYGATEDFVASRVPSRKVSPQQRAVFEFFGSIRALRESPGANPETRWRELYQRFQGSFAEEWLAGIELVELVHLLGLKGCSREKEALEQDLRQRTARTGMVSECISDGLRIADMRL